MTCGRGSQVLSRPQLPVVRREHKDLNLGYEDGEVRIHPSARILGSSSSSTAARSRWKKVRRVHALHRDPRPEKAEFLPAVRLCALRCFLDDADQRNRRLGRAVRSQVQILPSLPQKSPATTGFLFGRSAPRETGLKYPCVSAVLEASKTAVSDASC